MNLKKAMMFVLFVIVLSTLIVAQEEVKSNGETGEAVIKGSPLSLLLNEKEERVKNPPANPIPATFDEWLKASASSTTPSGVQVAAQFTETLFDDISVDENGIFYQNSKQVDQAKQKEYTDKIKANPTALKNLQAAQQKAKANGLQAKAAKIDEELKQQNNAERIAVANIAEEMGLTTVPKKGLNREEIKQATNCFHTPTCKNFKLSDNDAATLYEGLAVGYEEKADSFIHTQQELKENKELFSSAVDGWQATIGGKTYVKEGELWRETKTGEVKSDLEVQQNAESIQSSEYAATKKRAEAARQDAESASVKTRWWQGIGSEGYQTLVKGQSGFGQVAGGGIRALQALGSYRSLSNLIFPDATKNGWLIDANDETLNFFADLPAFASSAVCLNDDRQRAESPGQSTAFFRTQSGTYQSVGALQVEKSPRQSFILCDRNPDEESDQEFICPEDFVCKNDEFCYKNEDDEEPVKGKFYKIHWRVTAPQDEKFTPFVDENGVAVSFNIFLEGSGQALPVYKRGEFITGTDVIQLNNGDTDGAIVAKYRPEDFTRACIRFKHNIKSSVGSDISEICADIKEIEKGEIEYEGSQRLPSITSSSPGVTLNI
ncbi:MAG: hypothetical protein Q8Q01_01500 [archaeon]|nr:hypothetical protein [archaeon]